MIKLAVSGCLGRMGQKITNLALQKKELFEITTLLEYENHPNINEPFEGFAISSNNNDIKGSDVLIEFTLPEGTLDNLKACVKHNVAMVIGTTGIKEKGAKEIEEASKQIPIIFASNMSIGVNVLFKATELAAKKLTEITDIAIYEEHHCHKKDAPSGTAKTLAQVAQRGSSQEVRFFPDPLREGEIIGNHEVTFDTKFDIFKLYHSAKDRDMFASGALTAAVFLKNKKSGLFNMQQVLGLDKITIH